MKKRAPDWLIETLHHELLRLNAMTDPLNKSCALPREVKEANRIYVHSWMIPKIEEALAWAKGRPCSISGHYELEAPKAKA